MGLTRRIPPGAIYVTVSLFVWAVVLILGFAVGNPVVAALQLATTTVFLALLGLHKLLADRRGRPMRPEQAEGWWEREVGKQPEDQLVMEWLPGLELEYDYRLGLKQRPEPVKPAKVTPGLTQLPTHPMTHEQLIAVAPTGLPPVPQRTAADTLPMWDGVARGLRQVRPPKGSDRPSGPPQRMKVVGPGAQVVGSRSGLDPELLEAARGLLRAIPRERKAWRSEHVHAVAAIMQRARAQNRAGALLALYDDEPALYWSNPGEVCRCGHVLGVHTPFNRPRLIGEPESAGRKCTGTCECVGYRRVPLVPLDSHGMPSPAAPVAFETEVTEW